MKHRGVSSRYRQKAESLCPAGGFIIHSADEHTCNRTQWTEQGRGKPTRQENKPVLKGSVQPNQNILSLCKWRLNI